MDSESQRIYDRMSLHRLAKKYPHWQPIQFAADLGRSERWVRKWLQRFESVARHHFSMYLSQSRAPKHRPRQTPNWVKDAICELRETLSEQYHRPAGASLIRHYLPAHLQEYPSFHETETFVPTSTRTLNRILRERGYIRSPRRPEHQPLVLSDPMTEWEMDFCEIRLPRNCPEGRFEFFLVVDRGTSRVVHIEGCEGYRADTALAAVIRLFALHGLPKRLRFDRDSRFVWSWSADSFPAPLIRLLHALGVEPVVCPPRRPDKKPYVERCVRTFKYEWLRRFTLDTLANVYEAIETFPHYHNAQRLHMGRACQGRTPDEAFPQLPTLPALPESVDPNHWLQIEHGRIFRRRIRSNGTIQVDKHIYYVDERLAKYPVLVHLDGEKRCFRVTVDGLPHAKSLPLKGLYDDSMNLHDYLKLLQEEAQNIAHYHHMVWMRSGDVA